jgi:hypothetical protein
MRDLGVVLFFLGILGIVGIPGFAALLITVFSGRLVKKAAHVFWLFAILAVLWAWQTLALHGLARLHAATSGSRSYDGLCMTVGALGAALALWVPGRQLARLATQAPGAHAPHFDPARAAALFALAYLAAFFVQARTPSPYLAWLQDWPPLWASAIVMLIVAAGLWTRRWWAWWLGLAACVTTIYLLSSDPDFSKRLARSYHVYRAEPFPFLLALLFALLLPGARPAYTLARHTRSQADEAPP